jgi:hypothetical protein
VGRQFWRLACRDELGYEAHAMNAAISVNVIREAPPGK